MFRLFSLSFYFLFLGINFNLVAMQPDPVLPADHHEFDPAQHRLTYCCPVCQTPLFVFLTFEDFFNSYITNNCNCNCNQPIPISNR